jgi:hypothetical protein
MSQIDDESESLLYRETSIRAAAAIIRMSRRHINAADGEIEDLVRRTIEITEEEIGEAWQRERRRH